MYASNVNMHLNLTSRLPVASARHAASTRSTNEVALLRLRPGEDPPRSYMVSRIFCFTGRLPRWFCFVMAFCRGTTRHMSIDGRRYETGRLELVGDVKPRIRDCLNRKEKNKIASIVYALDRIIHRREIQCDREWRQKGVNKIQTHQTSAAGDSYFPHTSASRRKQETCQILTVPHPAQPSVLKRSRDPTPRNGTPTLAVST